MIQYAARALGAHLRGGRTLFALAVAGVALGVGSVLSIQILNQGALGAFAGGVRAVSGEAQLTILGGGPTLDDARVRDVLDTPGVRAALPLVRAEVALDGRPGATLELVGVDLLAPVRLPWGLPRGDLAAALGRPGWVAVAPELAAEMGWAPGASIAASLGTRRLALRVGAVVDVRRVAPLASRRLALMDIAQAQAALGAPGRVAQIDVVAQPGADLPALARRLEARLGPGVRAVTPEQRLEQADALLSAFRLNLTALALVSLLVGGFLVHASTEAALARRREELGVLRCLGATRAAVVGLVLGDAALLGLLGTAAGLPLGWAAARAQLGAVSATLRDVYLLEGVERVTLTPGLIALAIALGLGGAAAGALWPALEVAREDPRALLGPRGEADGRGGALARRLAAAGAALLAATAAVTLGPARRWPPGGFGLALAVLGAAALAAPALLAAAGRLRPPRRLGVAFGARELAAHLRSSAVAAGALAVAVSMMAGVTLMIGSFRATVADWLGATLRADVYVTTTSWRRGRSEATLDPATVARLAAAPGVRAVDRLRQLAVELGGRRVAVSGFDAALPEASGRVQLVSGDAAEALARVRRGEVLVSEPLARRRGLGPGDALVLPAAGGPRRFTVAGVYRDYGAEGGSVLMDLPALADAFGPGPLTNVALLLAPGQDPERAVARLRAAHAGEPLLIRSNRRLREDVMAVFDQTFAVTRLLQAMALVVAVAGVALALLVMARERASEVALLRALGATRGQVFRVFLGRGLGIAGAGLALGACGGAGLAAVLVEVVNPAWFGWSLAFHVPWAALGREALAIVAAAALASIYPAVRASGTPATELARDAL